jgi:hypothetical protein
LKTPFSRRGSKVSTLLFFVLASAISIGSEPLPRVLSADVPPSVGVYGTVWLRLRTDGHAVSTAIVLAGPAALSQVALENVRSWRFAPHPPTQIDVTFRYEEIPAQGCDQDSNSQVTMNLPDFVEVRGRGHRDSVRSCGAPSISMENLVVPVQPLAGVVRCENCLDHHPIAGATVRLGHGISTVASTISNADGTFVLAAPAQAGDYWIGIDELDYVGADANVRFDSSASSSHPLVVQLHKRWESIRDPGASVDRAQMPTYPPSAIEQGLSGSVVLEADTDGTFVVGATAKSGQPLLAEAALQNIKTWHLTANKSRRFVTTYRYVLSLDGCGDTPKVVMTFPTDVEIRACRH